MSRTLHIIYDNCQEDNKIKDERKDGTNHPEERQSKILQYFNSSTFKLSIQQNEQLADEKVLTAVHCSTYIRFLANAHTSAKQYADKDWYKPALDSLIPYNLWISQDSKRDELVKRQPFYKQAGMFASDTMTPILANTYTNASRSAQNCILGADYLIHNQNTIVYALNSSPGHHASQSRYAGYCFFNNAALAADRLLTLGVSQVAILDLD